MTGQADWGLGRSQDDADSTSWGGKNVFDVYSKSQATGQRRNALFRLAILVKAWRHG